MSAAVVSTSVMGSDATTIHRGRGSAAANCSDLLAERSRVGEEQGRIEPEDDQTLDLFGIRIGVHIVVAGNSLDSPQAACCRATTIGGRR